MNKTKIKNFAIWARKKLMADIAYKAGLLGITDQGIKSPLPSSTTDMQLIDIGTKAPYAVTGEAIKQRSALVDLIHRKAKQADYLSAYQAVIEEVAYTWFNRLIAVRFMEVNDYLPSGIRVLSSEHANKIEPDIVTKPFDTDLTYSPQEKARIMQLMDDNQLDELFRMLLIKQCNALNTMLPHLFEKTNDYSELLLNLSFTNKEGVVYRLVHDIDEADFQEAVEIIGWMYQYYNEERKNQVINIYKGTIKKEDIPAATQLFTTDWVVRYMVDNSLGRYWIERNPHSKLHEKLQYFVTPKSGHIQMINEKITPEQLTFFDPCMGSGHILVYAFDVLMEIYRECGYLDRDAAQKIVENNLFGLDIDDRAYQLAYFAVMMKARSYDRRFFSRNVTPHVYEIVESNEIEDFEFAGVTKDPNQNQIGSYLINTFRHAKEIGSLLTVKPMNYESFAKYLADLEAIGPNDLFASTWFHEVLPLMKRMTNQAITMSQKYTVVCTNPPYMNKIEGNLKKFMNDQYKSYGSDLFSAFMYKNFDYCIPRGYSAFMTPFVWMFIKTYEKLREFMNTNKSIATLIQFEYSAFEEATVPICTFVLHNTNENQTGLYLKLSDFKGGMEVQRLKVLEALENKECGYFYETNQLNFPKIPGMPIAYWVSGNLLSVFEKGEVLKNQGDTRQGMATSDNNKFLRLWFEVVYHNIGFNILSEDDLKTINKKWYPYNKGGEFRKWYGNTDYTVNYKNNGEEIKAYATLLYNTPTRTIKSINMYFKYCLSWSKISSGSIAFRYYPNGYIFDVAGCSIFYKNDDFMLYDFGFLNSIITKILLSAISPTLNYEAGHIASLPMIREKSYFEQVRKLTSDNINISKTDWDSFETSWDFKSHPLVQPKSLISDAFTEWNHFTDDQFNQLKANEEELNRIFIDIYGLQEELTPEVEDKDVTVRKADLDRDVRSFISYAVGCMFGRYSLDVDGLAYAGGAWDDSQYHSYIPDRDNILPITDEEYFSDDIVGLFVNFVRQVYGAETLEENLSFIANALGHKGNTAREVIRQYFLKEFFKDHCKVYQKRPIYWLFDSGKEDGFKALIYLHRYDENTIGNLRIDYLHRMQRIYEREIARMQETVDRSTHAREVATAQKRKERLLRQLKEIKDYDVKVAHLAVARISIDLDDGIKANYDKLQTSTDGKKLDILAKI